MNIMKVNVIIVCRLSWCRLCFRIGVIRKVRMFIGVVVSLV